METTASVVAGGLCIVVAAVCALVLIAASLVGGERDKDIANQEAIRRLGASAEEEEGDNA